LAASRSSTTVSLCSTVGEKGKERAQQAVQIVVHQHDLEKKEGGKKGKEERGKAVYSPFIVLPLKLSMQKKEEEKGGGREKRGRGETAIRWSCAYIFPLHHS